jgi:hypothetical protein
VELSMDDGSSVWFLRTKGGILKVCLDTHRGTSVDTHRDTSLDTHMGTPLDTHRDTSVLGHS